MLLPVIEVGSVPRMADLEIRTPGPDDIPALLDLRTQAFGGRREAWGPAELTTPLERGVVAFDRDRPVGTVYVLDFQQWFGGRKVRCGGVAGVTVAPDQRGRGVARRLLAEATTRMRADGAVVSALFPTSTSLYRSLGWEVAGWWAKRSITTSELPMPSGEVDWVPVDRADPALARVYESMAEHRDGWVVPPADWWAANAARSALPGADPSWSWLGRRGGEPVAAVAYGHQRSQRAMFDIDTDLIAGVDGPALADALALIGAHGTTSDQVITTLPERLLTAHLDQPSRTRTSFDWPWMLRLVDLPGAMAARGWPGGVTARVHLDLAGPKVADPAGASGRWVLEVADCQASCTPGGDGTVRLSMGTLAALYAGGASPEALAYDGTLTGSDGVAMDALRTAFAGDPTLPIFF